MYIDTFTGQPVYNPASTCPTCGAPAIACACNRIRNEDNIQWPHIQ